MKEFFRYIIIIAIIALIGFICYMIWKKSNPDPITDPPGPGKKDSKEKESIEDDSDDTITTHTFTEWSVVQLHPESGRPIKKMNLVIPSTGRFTIGRSKECDFVLQGAKAEDGTSRLHLGVGKDNKGYFAKPISREDDSLALTYIGNDLVMKSFDLSDKQVIWLGNTPIAFIRNASKRKDLKFNPDTAANKRDTATFERDRNDTMVFGRNAHRSDDNTFSR